MPNRSIHLMFDDYLKERDIIYEDTSGDTVHDRMDRDFQIHGHWNHRYEDYYHDPDGIRNWIRSWAHLGYQETLTDYVRIAYGHLVLDEIDSRMEWDDVNDLLKSAYRSYIARGFHRTFFRS